MLGARSFCTRCTGQRWGARRNRGSALGHGRRKRGGVHAGPRRTRRHGQNHRPCGPTGRGTNGKGGQSVVGRRHHRAGRRGHHSPRGKRGRSRARAECDCGGAGRQPNPRSESGEHACARFHTRSSRRPTSQGPGNRPGSRTAARCLAAGHRACCTADVGSTRDGTGLAGSHRVDADHRGVVGQKPAELLRFGTFPTSATLCVVGDCHHDLASRFRRVPTPRTLPHSRAWCWPLLQTARLGREDIRTMLPAYVLVQTEVGMAVGVAAQLARIPGVVSAEVTAGPYDVIARAESANLDELGRLVVAKIQGAEGVTRTLTCIWRTSSRSTARYSISVQGADGRPGAMSVADVCAWSARYSSPRWFTRSPAAYSDPTTQLGTPTGEMRLVRPSTARVRSRA